jgi:hypothetical protein
MDNVQNTILVLMYHRHKLLDLIYYTSADIVLRTSFCSFLLRERRYPHECSSCRDKIFIGAVRLTRSD